MGLFDGITDIDFNEVEEYQLGIPAGTYQAVVANIGTESKDSGVFMVITYTVTEGKLTGKSHKERQLIPPTRGRTENEEKSAKFIKTRLLSLGIPEDRINTFEADEVQGTEVALTLVDNPKNPQYRNVARVVVLNGSSNVPDLPGTSTTATASAGAKSENPYG